MSNETLFAHEICLIIAKIFKINILLKTILQIIEILNSIPFFLNLIDAVRIVCHCK